MDASKDYEKLLDQIQAQYDSVLEQTGRMFASLNRNNAPPTAQLHKLKHLAITAQDRLNEALSPLQWQILRTEQALRRDLAMCRQREGPQDQPSATGNQANSEIATEAPKAEATASDLEADHALAPNHTSSVQAEGDDTTMRDAEPDQTTTFSEPEQQSAAELLLDDQAPAAEQVKDESTQNTDATVHSNGGKALTEPSLHIDTKPSEEDSTKVLDQPDEDDKVPDTADTNNNADLDSLFGGPMSVTATENNDFSFDQTTDFIDQSAPPDFNFDSFSTNFDTNPTDNDNISSLLPGLEDYAANNHPMTSGNDVDLNTLFGTTTNEDAQPAVDGQDDANFDFFGNFEAGDDGGGAPVTNNGADLDFDALFNDD